MTHEEDRVQPNLRDDAKAREYGRHLALDGLLESILGAAAAPSRGETRKKSALRPAGRRRSGSGWRWLAAAAAIVAIGLAVLLFRGEYGPLPIAQVARVQGTVRFVGGEVVRQGADLLPGQGLETVGSGSAVSIRFPDGTGVDLNGGTRLARIDENGAGRSLKLDTGTLAIDTGRPMRVRTPRAEAKVLGTRFTLRVSEDATRLEVKEGKVRLTSSVDQKSVEVPSGHFAVAATDVELVARPLSPPRPSEPGRSPSAMAALASRMEPRTWAELSTEGFANGAILAPGGMPNYITQESDSACWDPVSRQFLFQGESKTNPIWTLVAYSEDTNAWRTIPPHPDLAKTRFSSAGDHNAFDPATGNLYHRPSGSDRVYRFSVREGNWGELPPVPEALWRASSEIAAGLKYFPEMGGLVLVGGSQPEEGPGKVVFFDARAQEWRLLAKRLAMGPYHNFIEYNPARKIVILGGGNGSRELYKLESPGRITRMKDAPFILGITQTVVTVDPAGGRYLVLHSTGLYEYDPDADAWTLMEGPLPPVLSAYGGVGDGLIEAPIPSHGVVMFVKYALNNSKVFLYKHSLRGK